MKNQALPPSLSPENARAGWCWMAFQLLLLPQLVRLAAGALPRKIGEVEVNFLYQLCGALGTAILFRSYLLDSLCWALGRPRRFFPVCAAALGAYYAAGWIIAALIGAVDPEFVNSNDQTILRLRQEGPALTALATVFLAPVTEECLFRGLVFRRMLPRSRRGAYALSTACFGLLHVAGYLGTYTPLQLGLCLLQYLPAGVCLAWSDEKSGTIVAPILVHAVINAVSMARI